MRTWETIIKQEEYETCSKPRAWKKLLFGLSFTHAVVQERRKFGPLGWNIRYEFNDTDMEASVQTLKIFLEANEEIPWDSMSFMTGHINYGGRVTDDWDRRCLMSILSQYYTPEILDDNYRFSTSGHYYSPPEGDLASVKAYISGLSLSDDPEIFGLHENANITFQMAESSRMFNIVLSIQPRVTTGGEGLGKTPDQIVTEIADEILKSLPDQLSMAEAGPTTFQQRENGLLDSLATVLSQEMVKFNRLLQVMKSTLLELKRAIRGLVVMSAELDDMFQAFLNNKVPPNWSKVSFASLKPLASWVRDLHNRVSFMRHWLQNGQPASFPLSLFYFPQV